MNRQEKRRHERADNKITKTLVKKYEPRVIPKYDKVRSAKASKKIAAMLAVASMLDGGGAYK